MNSLRIIFCVVLAWCAQGLIAPRALAQAERGEDLDFEATVVEGQTGGTGQIVLLQRGRRRLPSLVRERSGFFHATVVEVLGGEPMTRRRARRTRAR